MYDNCPQLSFSLNRFRATVLVIPVKAGIQLLFSPVKCHTTKGVPKKSGNRTPLSSSGSTG
jgi:hypothetical protein